MADNGASVAHRLGKIGELFNLMAQLPQAIKGLRREAAFEF